MSRGRGFQFQADVADLINKAAREGIRPQKLILDMESYEMLVYLLHTSRRRLADCAGERITIPKSITVNAMAGSIKIEPEEERRMLILKEEYTALVQSRDALAEELDKTKKELSEQRAAYSLLLRLYRRARRVLKGEGSMSETLAELSAGEDVFT